jgi:hypothetical protein
MPRNSQMKKKAPHPKIGKEAEPNESFVGI